ncbi:MAG: site-2 protease family protein [Planctomycetes bacterium]|nr:site-2 protease family protein [Planctomycetota bacterium]
MDHGTIKICRFLLLVVSVILHELGHAWAAHRLGDDTAKRAGRITVNPLPHIDPFMTVILPLVLVVSGSPIIFGGAKPVPVNPFAFRHVSPRKGMMLVGAAGPLVNLLLMLLCSLLLALLSGISPIFTLLLCHAILLNSLLFVLNMIPIPPLDGSRILAGLTPKNFARELMRLERFGLFFIFFLLFLFQSEFLSLVFSLAELFIPASLLHSPPPPPIANGPLI